MVSSLLPHRFQVLPDQTASLAADLQELTGHVQRLTAEVQSQREAVDRGYQQLIEQLAEISRLRGEDRAELTSLAARGRVAASEAVAAPAEQAMASRPDIDSFYSGFEERFRGEARIITEKLTPYLRTITGLDRGEAAVLDIGPGRCEWLRLLREAGVAAYGVDTNPRFVELGEALGLDVRLGDAIDHVRHLPDRTLAAITAFQVAEHLPSDVLFDLVDHSLRSLQPGGVLILETPNPRNLIVGASEFWIDPTHLRPLHPQFLEYLLINRGFVDVEVRVVNPTEEPFDLAALGRDETETRRVVGRLNELLFSGSDFAVIGRRAAAS